MSKIEFGMFTEEGEYQIGRIFNRAITDRLTWKQVTGLLQELSENPKFEEAMDTVVRERLWECLFYESRP